MAYPPEQSTSALDSGNHRGWIGSSAELLGCLAANHCDQDAAGKYCVDGSITSFMGAGDEYVVAENAVYYVAGEAKSLVHALEVGGTGLRGVVIF